MVLDAVLAALAGALCYAIAAALQHHEAARADTHGVLNPALLWQLAHRPLWLAGVASTGLGAALHIFALSEAPLVLVQPLGVTCLIFAVPLAAGLNHHRVRVSELVAALAILVGLAAVVSTIPAAGDPMAVAVQARAVVLLLLGAGGLIGVLALMARRVAQRPRARSLVLALRAGVAFGATSSLARVLLQLHDRPAAAETMVLAGAGIVLLAPLGFLLMQSAYRSGGFTVALAAITVVDPLFAATSGVVLLHEPLAATPTHALLVATGAVLATLGISVLARSPVHAPTHAAGDRPGTGQPRLLSRTPADARPTMNHPQPTELDAAPDAHPRSLRRLLIGTDTYHPDVNGAAYFTYRLAVGLARRGHDVHVVCPSADGVASTRVEDGVTAHRIRSFRTPVHPEFRVCLPATAARGTAAIVRDVEPDIVHVQGHFPIGRSLLRAARREGVPVVATNHFMPENLLAYVHVPAAARRIATELAWRDFGRVFNQADHITTPTPIAADLIRRRGLRPRVQAVSCGIDLDRFHVTSRTAQPDPVHLADRPTILFVGRLDEEKHVHELIGALPIIRRHVDAQVVLVGTGSQQRRLATLSEQLGVAGHVHFLGFVPDHQLPAIYRGSDLFVMPGIAELQSLVTLEAMASGLPVIAANAMALPHLVHPGVNGYLYRPGDLEELAGHIEAVLATPVEQRRMGRASRDLARRHDDTATFTRFESLYTSCIGSPAVAEALAYF